jgi:signal peptidase I
MKNWLRENRGLILFLLCFGAFRTAVADWNPVPTGSMRPTILEGDVVLVNRLAYDLKLPLTDIALARLGEPQRGDIVTFSSPKDGSRLIKRLVGVPGDVIELRQGALLVNGEHAAYSGLKALDEIVAPGLSVGAARAVEHIAGHHRTVQVYPRFGTAKDFGPVTVPAEHYFMLGDNRDNSEDSRFIGFVPRAALIGRAGRILVSADILGHWLPRLERTAARLQ